MRRVRRVNVWGNDVALHVHRHYRDNFLPIGLQQGVASPCMCFHVERKLGVFIHDDFCISSGHDADIVWFGNELTKAFECKMHAMGPENKDLKHANVFNTWPT